MFILPSVFFFLLSCFLRSSLCLFTIAFTPHAFSGEYAAGLLRRGTSLASDGRECESHPGKSKLVFLWWELLWGTERQGVGQNLSESLRCYPQIVSLDAGNGAEQDQLPGEQG